VGADLERIIGLDSNDFSEYVSAITNAFINRLTTETVGGVQAGLLAASTDTREGAQTSSSGSDVRNRLGGLADVFQTLGQALGQLAGTALAIVGEIFDSLGRVCVDFGLGGACLWDMTGANLDNAHMQVRTAEANVTIQQCTTQLTTSNLEACGNRIVALSVETRTTIASSTQLFSDLLGTLQNTISASTGGTSCLSPSIVNTKGQEVAVYSAYRELFDFSEQTAALNERIVDVGDYLSSITGTLPRVSGNVTLNSIIADIQDAQELAADPEGDITIVTSLLSNAVVRLRAMGEFSPFLGQQDLVNTLAIVAGDVSAIIQGIGAPTANVAGALANVLIDLQNLQNAAQGLPPEGIDLALAAIEQAFGDLAFVTTQDASASTQDAISLVFHERDDAEDQYNILRNLLAPKITQAQQDYTVCAPPPPPEQPEQPQGA
jgi:hypothetical protein